METMPTERSYQPFLISVEELSHWEKRPHRHNFFELVYVEQGEGEQCINEFRAPYGPGSLFLLPPTDCHAFYLRTPTRFTFIRFTSLLFSKQQNHAVDYSQWFEKVSYILSSYNKLPGEIIGNAADKQHLIMLIKGLQMEYSNPDKYSSEVISSSMVSILNILTRNVERRLVSQYNAVGANFGEVLNYIQHHLPDRDALRLTALAARFHVAPTYFGEYFRKHAGESLQDYIIKSRLKIAEAKLRRSDQSIKEIAYELAFTDASHLAKMFKKFYHMSIGEFRQAQTVCLP